VRKKLFGIANTLAILTVVTMTTSNSYADTDGLSVPRHSSDPVTVRLAGGSGELEAAEASEMLQVYVGTSDLCCEGRTPIAGRYLFDNDTLSFTPAFGFDVGQDYVVRVRISGSNDGLAPFTIPSEGPIVDAAVTATFPSGVILPENVLRFYIHFSTPMSPQVAFDYIKLRDAAGNIDNAAFMRFKQELWNEDRTRLTVLIDPGRIKREVATNVELGPALRVGQLYTLSVEGGWPSADGASVLPDFSRTFAVSEALRELPDVGLWQGTSPCAESRDPLLITFDRPFDRHLLTTDIRLFSVGRSIIGGVVLVGEDERSWTFIPNDPWADEEMEIVANAALEDVAGNNFHDLLDHLRDADAVEVSSTALSIRPRNCGG
jgi:hypothetical protein